MALVLIVIIYLVCFVPITIISGFVLLPKRGSHGEKLK